MRKYFILFIALTSLAETLPPSPSGIGASVQTPTKQPKYVIAPSFPSFILSWNYTNAVDYYEVRESTNLVNWLSYTNTSNTNLIVPNNKRSDFFYVLAHPSVPASNDVYMEWTASISPDVIGYRIYYGIDSYVYYPYVDVGSATNGTVVGLLPGIKYYFNCTAYVSCPDCEGQILESPFNGEVSYTVPTTNQPISIPLIMRPNFE